MPWDPTPTSKRHTQLPTNWQTIRQQVLTRDHRTCVNCGKPGNHVDHIQRGQDHSIDNLRTLCQHCHMKRTGADGGTTPRRPRRHARAPEPHPGYKTNNMHNNA